jgi:hypothetical protein
MFESVAGSLSTLHRHGQARVSLLQRVDRSNADFPTSLLTLDPLQLWLADGSSKFAWIGK